MRISVWEETPWTDGKAAVIHRHIDEACRPTGCWPSPAVPFYGLVYLRGKKEAEFQVTLPAPEFLVGVDTAWPFYHCLSYPQQRCHLHFFEVPPFTACTRMQQTPLSFQCWICTGKPVSRKKMWAQGGDGLKRCLLSPSHDKYSAVLGL